MKTSTLFRAYRKCQSEMSWCENGREKHNYGILVGNDPDAKQYQQLHRLLLKLNRVIISRLDQLDKDAEYHARCEHFFPDMAKYGDDEFRRLCNSETGTAQPTDQAPR